MKKIFKLLVIITSVVFAILACGSIWYVWKFYPRRAQAFEQGDPSWPEHVFIATQASPFKDQTIQDLIALFDDKQVFFCIRDVSALDTIEASDWQGIAILSTSIANKLNGKVQSFLERTGMNPRLVVVTTSGGGDYVPSGLQVDGITTASRLSDTQKIARQILRTLNSADTTAVHP